MPSKNNLLNTFSVDETILDEFSESNGAFTGDCNVKMDNGKLVTMPVRLAIINGMYWSVYRTMGVQVTEDSVLWIETFTDETPVECGTKIYRDFVLKRRLPYLNVLGAIWISINKIFRYVHRKCKAYQSTLDALRLDRLCMQEPMKEVCSREIDDKLGSLAAEEWHKQMTDDMYKVLLTPGTLAYNPLIPFLRTKLLKRNQMPQMFGAYGTRADINDEMKKHVITANAFTGLRDVFDFCIEYLSAKKAQYFNNSIIRESQYFARRLRLSASRIIRLYPGSCGNTITLPIKIPKKFKHNFIGKWIKVTPEEFAKYDDEKVHMFDDCSIALTKNNIDYFVGKTVQMWSPFFCRHVDGVCEHCAGFMDQHASAFIPPDIQLGVYAATKLASSVTQKVLSAKHLIKTKSKEYVLGPDAVKYFSKNGDVLLWQAASIRQLQKCYVRVSTGEFGPISDLQHKSLPPGEGWSKLSMVQIVDEAGNVLDDVILTDQTTYPYFSNHAMSYLKNSYKELKIKTTHIDIPLAKFDFHKPLLKFTAVNDDMVTYVHNVDTFLCSKICDYHSLTSCIDEFSALVYSKSDISIFYIELMLRAFLITEGGVDHLIPVLKDPNQLVEFDRMSAAISESSITTKLSFERLDELFYLADPTLYSRGNGYGFNDAHFNCKNKIRVAK